MHSIPLLVSNNTLRSHSRTVSKTNPAIVTDSYTHDHGFHQAFQGFLNPSPPTEQKNESNISFVPFNPQNHSEFQNYNNISQHHPPTPSNNITISNNHIAPNSDDFFDFNPHAMKNQLLENLSVRVTNFPNQQQTFNLPTPSRSKSPKPTQVKNSANFSQNEIYHVNPLHFANNKFVQSAELKHDETTLCVQKKYSERGVTPKHNFGRNNDDNTFFHQNSPTNLRKKTKSPVRGASRNPSIENFDEEQKFYNERSNSRTMITENKPIAKSTNNLDYDVHYTYQFGPESFKSGKKSSAPTDLAIAGQRTPTIRNTRNPSNKNHHIVDTRKNSNATRKSIFDDETSNSFIAPPTANPNLLQNLHQNTNVISNQSSITEITRQKAPDASEFTPDIFQKLRILEEEVTKQKVLNDQKAQEIKALNLKIGNPTSELKTLLDEKAQKENMKLRQENQRLTERIHELEEFHFRKSPVQSNTNYSGNNYPHNQNLNAEYMTKIILLEKENKELKEQYENFKTITNNGTYQDIEVCMRKILEMEAYIKELKRKNERLEAQIQN